MNSVTFLFDAKIMKVKSVFTMRVFSGALLVKVHNIRKSSECLNSNCFSRHHFHTKLRTLACSCKVRAGAEYQEEGDEVETDIQLVADMNVTLESLKFVGCL